MSEWQVGLINFFTKRFGYMFVPDYMAHWTICNHKLIRMMIQIGWRFAHRTEWKPMSQIELFKKRERVRQA